MSPDPRMQIVRLDDGRKTPGRWDVARQAAFLTEHAPWPIAGRILDAGGNAGGIGIELQDCADEIIVLEKSALNERQFRFIAERRDASRVRFRRASLFTAHRLGRFDTVLMLGLFYHFRHPQMFLDYCGALNYRRFIFSTRTSEGEEATMFNRIDIGWTKTTKIMGWHPSRRAFRLMLEASGFRVDCTADVHDPGFTNDHYAFASKVQPLDADVEAIETLTRKSGFWT